MNAVAAWLVGTLAGFAGACGIWLASQTTYPFARTVGGATLVVSAIVAILVGLACVVDGEL